MLARPLRGLADAVAAKTEPRRTRKWVLCSLITDVYEGVRVGAFTQYLTALACLPRARRPRPALCLLTAKIASVHPVELGRRETERRNLEASCIAGNRVITGREGQREGESMAGTMVREFRSPILALSLYRVHVHFALRRYFPTFHRHFPALRVGN